MERGTGSSNSLPSSAESAANRAAALAAHPRLRPKGTEHVGSGLLLTSTPDVGLSCQISWSSLPFCSAQPDPAAREAQRTSPVATAEPSPAAQRKAARKRTDPADD